MAFLYNFQIIGRDGGRSPDLLTLAEASAQSFKKGQLIYAASGAWTVCGDAATVIAAIAQEDAVTSTSNDVTGEIIHHGDLLQCYYSGSTPTVGTQYGVVESPTGYSGATLLDQSNTTQVAFTVFKVLDTTKKICQVKPAPNQATVVFQFA